MRRLDEHFMLDRHILEHRLRPSDVEHLVTVLAHFYRSASPVMLSPATHLADLRASLAHNRRVLLDSRFNATELPIVAG